MSLDLRRNTNMKVHDEYIEVQKKLYDKYEESDVTLNVLKEMVQRDETIEDLIATLRMNGVEVNEELCRLVS